MRVLTENKEIREIVDRLINDGHIKLSEALILLEKEVVYEKSTVDYKYWGPTTTRMHPYPGSIATYTSGLANYIPKKDEPNETL